MRADGITVRNIALRTRIAPNDIRISLTSPIFQRQLESENEDDHWGPSDGKTCRGVHLNP